FTELPNWLKFERNHTFSPVICDRVCVFWPCDNIHCETRQVPEPPEPGSCGMTSLMRSSYAPTASAPLPLREQPVTPSRFGSMLAAGVFSMASIKRLAPQAQAITAPAECPLPNMS